MTNILKPVNHKCSVTLNPYYQGLNQNLSKLPSLIIQNCCKMSKPLLLAHNCAYWLLYEIY